MSILQTRMRNNTLMSINGNILISINGDILISINGDILMSINGDSEHQRRYLNEY